MSRHAGVIVKPTFAYIFISLLGICSQAQVFAQSKPIEVPFDDHKNEVLVEVMIDGRGPFRMMLDTGTNPSVIDLATADAIGIRRSGKGQSATGGGTAKNLAFECKLKNVEVGGLKVASIDAAAIDLSNVSDRLGKHLDGVLGHSFLNKRVVQFDYSHRAVRFFEQAPAVAAGAVTMRFRYANGVLIDNVWINGRRAIGNLDTGSSGMFALTPAAITRLGLTDEAAKATVSTSVGYNGKYENRVGTVGSIRIGDIDMRDAEVTYFSAGTGYEKRPWDVNIGNPFFKDCVVTIDYQQKTVTFTKTTQSTDDDRSQDLNRSNI